MMQENTIRTYRPGDLAALVAMINEADANDKLERATTLEEMAHETTFPGASPETDWFLAWDGDRLAGYSAFYVRRGNPETDSQCFIYSWGVVHPHWRRRGLGRRLLTTAIERAGELLPTIPQPRVNFQCNTRDIEPDRIALYESLDMKPVRYFVNMARPLNGNLPPLQMPAGIRLRTFDPQRDAETVWQVDNTAFRDHWGFTEGSLDDFNHWLQMPHLRPDLWFLAEEEASGQVVGLGLHVIDPDWIAQTGRREGYVETLCVLREYRQRGLGAALLVQGFHALRQAGMEGVHLHADAENLTGAVRLYERVGFRVRKQSRAYQLVLRAR